MGKRKSKSSKQKQTKKKSGTILGKNGSKRKSNGNTNGGNDLRILCSLPKPRVNKQNPGLQQKQLSEKDDFDRQMNSLVERSRASEASRRKSGRRRKHPEHKLAASLTMKPASFSLEKSTNQLMEETMHQMGQIMSQTPQNTMQSTLPTTGGSSLARAAAAIPSSERTPIISNASHRTSFASNSSNITGIAGIGSNKDVKQNRNSFSALDDDSDEDDSSNAEIIRANTIQFAPAAFSLASTSTPSLLPTKTPPTTPLSTPNHHFLRASKRATSLFATINEEEIEELHYQRQMGKDTADKFHHAAADIDGDL